MELGNGIFLDINFTKRLFDSLDKLSIDLNSPVYLVTFSIISGDKETPLTLDSSASAFLMLLNEICKENIILTTLFLGMEDISGIKDDTFLSIKDKIIFEKSVAYRGLEFLMANAADKVLNVPSVVFTNIFGLLENCHLLHEACSGGNTEMVKWLIESGIDINVRNSMSDTSIHIATEKGRYSIVELLCEKEPLSINFTNNRLYTPLHIAICNKYLPLVELLIDKGSSLTAMTSGNDTPLHLAAYANFYEIVPILENNLKEESVKLCDIKNNLGFSPIHIAAIKGHWKLLKLLIPHTTNVDDPDTHCLSTPMHIAVKHIEGKGVQDLIEAGSKPNIMDLQGHSPLHIAAMHGHISHVGHLISNQHSVNIQSSIGNTPLHFAASYGHTECFKTLLKYGADLYAKNFKEETVMSKMIRNGSSAMRTLIFEMFPALNITNLLLYASKDNHKKCVENLLEEVQNCSVRLNVTGDTPLHLASKNGHISILKLLLNKVDVNEACYFGLTALHKAVQSQHVSCVKILLENGADVNSPCFKGMSPLHYSMEGDNEDIFMMLVKNGANLNAQMAGGLSLLHKGVLQSNNKLLKVILTQYSTGINVTDNSGMTPLHLAIYERNISVTQLLLEAGANRNVKTNCGLTPLLIAVKLGNEDLTKLLLSFGADVNIGNVEMFTPLHLSALYGYTSITQLLLSSEGVDCHKRDMYGRTLGDLIQHSLSPVSTDKNAGTPQL